MLSLTCTRALAVIVTCHVRPIGMQAVLGSQGICRGPNKGEWPHTTLIPCWQRCLEGALGPWSIPVEGV